MLKLIRCAVVFGFFTSQVCLAEDNQPLLESGMLDYLADLNSINEDSDRPDHEFFMAENEMVTLIDISEVDPNSIQIKKHVNMLIVRLVNPDLNVSMDNNLGSLDSDSLESEVSYFEYFVPIGNANENEIQAETAEGVLSISVPKDKLFSQVQIDKKESIEDLSLLKNSESGSKGTNKKLFQDFLRRVEL